MDKSSTILSLPELRHLQWLLGCLLSAVSALVFLFLDVEAWGVLALVLGISVLMALRPELPGRLPVWVRRVFLTGALGLFVWDLFNASGWLSAVTRLALLLLAYRGLGYRNRREELQGLLLGLFLIVVAGVMTVSVGFVFLLILFTLCALSLLYVSALGDAQEPVPERTAVPAWVKGASLGLLTRRLLQVLRPGVVLLSLGLFMALVAVSGLLFLVIPRFQIENSLFLEKLMPRRSHSGFTDTVRYGQDTEVLRDETVVLNIDVPEGQPLERVPYLRMIVLDEYVRQEGFRQSAAFRRQGYEERVLTATQLRGNQRPGKSDEGNWTFYLEPGQGRYLPLPASYGLLRFREPQRLRVARSSGLVLLQDEQQSMLAYQVQQARDDAWVSDPEFSRQKVLGKGEVITQCLKLPVDEASLQVLKEVAGRIRASAPGDAFPAAASRWLNERHRYALVNHVNAGAGDVLVRWLASEEPGHCELFAGALILLCRNEGIPARMIVGFHGGQWNAYSKNFSVRNSDAHAWCEVWDGKSGWSRMDPTPGAGEGEAQNSQQLLESLKDDSWGARFTSYRVFWYRRVVSFDAQSQVAFWDGLRDLLLGWKRSLVAALESSVAKVKAWYAYAGVLGSILASVGVLLVQVLLLLALLFLYRNWRQHRRHKQDTLPRLRREAGQWLQRLQEVGLDTAAAPLVRRLERLRYGPPEVLSEPTHEALFREARVEWRRLRGGRGRR